VVTVRSRGHLPHWESERATYFVTFRLADSLQAWAVMPNHVHAVFTPQKPFHLANIVHSWKSYSAVQANRILGRQGSFWQREYYDHLVRDDTDFDRIVRYVLDNPRKAGLLDWRWVGSS
jgi:REP element-mobilizing transposase RayT